MTVHTDMTTDAFKDIEKLEDDLWETAASRWSGATMPEKPGTRRPALLILAIPAITASWPSVS